MFTNLKLWVVVVRHNFKWENSLYLFFETRIFTNLDVQTGISVPTIMIQATKTHHYIIFFVRPLHSKPGMENYC